MEYASLNDAIASFRDAMADGGVNPPPEVVADGKLHRFSTNGSASDDAGFYVLFGDNYPAGRFGCWRESIDQTWAFRNGCELSAEDKAERDRLFTEAKRLRDAERAKDAAAARERAHMTWKAATTPGEHPYLERKQIEACGARVHDGKLVIPMIDSDGDLHTLQMIDANGEKRFTIGGRTRGLYFPIGKKRDRFVFAEGFATAASIYKATGHTAVVCFSAKNMKSVVTTLRKKYPDAEFVIAADNDETGIEAANEAARLNQAAVVIPPNSGKDFNDVFVELGADAVENLIAGESIEPAPPEKRPLRRAVAPSEDFPVDALGDVLGPMAKAVQHAVQAPLAMCAASVLGAAALATQGHANVVMDGRHYPISLMVLILGTSGERKSEVDRITLGPVYSRQEALAKVFEKEIQRYDIEVAAYKAAKIAATSGARKTLDERRGALEELGPPPERPREPILLCTEPTYEGLIKLFITGQPSMGLFSDEGGAFISGHGMSGDQQIKTAAGLCDLHGGKPISRVRAGDGANLIYHRRLSVCLMAQPEVAAILLNNTLLSKQGLLARMFLTWPESTIGSRRYRPIDVMSDPAVVRYYEVMGRILTTPFPTPDDRPNELKPRDLQLNDEAKAAWVELHDQIEGELGRGELSSIRAHGAKAGEAILRVAAVLSLLRDFDREYIDKPCVVDASRLVEFFLNETARLESAQLSDPEIEKAEQLIEWCRERDASIVTAVELYQYGPNQIRTAADVRTVMATLQEHGWAEPLPDGAKFEGVDRKEAWRVYP